MNIYKRAIKYLSRKKTKAVILFSLLLTLNTLVLCGITIIRASEEGKEAIQKNTQTKLFAEISDEDYLIQDVAVEEIYADDNVDSINCISNAIGYLKNGVPVTGNNEISEINSQIKLYGYDDYKQDGPIVDAQIRLYEGNVPKNNKEALVHRDLAKINGWKIGDQIGIKGINGEEVLLQISGIYFSGREEEQNGDLQSLYRIENQIYTTSEQIIELQNSQGYEKIIVYLNNPEELETTKENVQKILGDKVEVIEADALYKQLKYPLEQISQIMRLILILIVCTSMIVVTLLLCMWVRARKKEIAVFISLGETKLKILFQIFIETLTIFFISFIASTLIGTVLSKYLEKILELYVEKNIVLNVAIKIEDLILVLVIGGIIVMIGIAISLVPVMNTNPKDTLSEMEG